MTNNEFADGLRAVADFYERHPEIPAPATLVLDNYRLNTKEEAALVMRALGSCKKHYGDEFDLLTISKELGPVTMRFVFTRSAVCTRRVIGVDTIPEKFVEAYTEPARTQEIVEWECGPILENAAAQDAMDGVGFESAKVAA